ncbi:DNA cytosine methyltransferase [Bordetella genomosp. 1]|uniref:DNA cytosine methyltransferase n=1 Tax=Bordetella genomosp. 1 TaxID=1395607 RepID=UPI001C3D3880
MKEFLSRQWYSAWHAALNALGYAVLPHLWDAADCGVPQHRLRNLIAGTRRKHPFYIRAPRAPHVAIRDVIDFSTGRWTNVEKPGRSPNTLARVQAGRAKFGDRFVMPYYKSGFGLTGSSLDRPPSDGYHRRALGRCEGQPHAHAYRRREPGRTGVPARLYPTQRPTNPTAHAGRRQPSQLAQAAIERIKSSA